MFWTYYERVSNLSIIQIIIVITNKLFFRKDLITNTKIVSRTTMELGFVAIAESDKNKAKNMLSQAIKSSTKKFKTNSILIRSHTALRTIGVEVETANE